LNVQSVFTKMRLQQQAARLLLSLSGRLTITVEKRAFVSDGRRVRQQIHSWQPNGNGRFINPLIKDAPNEGAGQ
jgi:hypothetical protein